MNKLNSNSISRIKNNQQGIVDSYQRDSNLKRVAREFNVTKYLVEMVLKLHNIPKRINRVRDFCDKTSIVKLYIETRNTKLVAREFGVSVGSIHRILHDENVRVNPMRYTNEEIIEKYKELKKVVATSRELKISMPYIHKVLKLHNIEKLSHKRKVK